MSVRVPDNVSVGQEFHVLLPDGRTIAVPVVQGSASGSEIIVQVPPQPPSQPPPQRPPQLNERGLPSEAGMYPGAASTSSNVQTSGNPNAAPPGTAGAGDKGMRRLSYGILNTVASGIGAAAKATATAVGKESQNISRSSMRIFICCDSSHS